MSSSQPRSWITVSLGEQVDIFPGFAFKSAGFSDDPEDVLLLRGDNVAQGVLRWSGAKRWPRAASADFESYQLRDGDVIVAMDRPWIEAGLKWAVVRASDLPSLLVQRVARLRASNGLLQEYLPYVIGAPAFTRQVRAVQTGTAVPHISASQIGAFRVSLPPLDEQRRIAAVLASLDDKIESNNRLSGTQEELARAVVERALAASRRAWPESALGNVLTVLETGNRPRGGVKGITEGVPSIGAESIIRAGVFDFAKLRFVSREYYEGLRRGRLQDGDVLLYKDGGRPGDFRPHVSMVGQGFPFEEAAINEHVYRLRIAPPYSQEFLYTWLSTDRLTDEMRRRGTGVAIPGLKSTAVRELPIVRPDGKVLAEVQDVIAPLMRSALSTAKEARMLSQIRDTLLPKLVSGEIRVARDEVGGEPTELAA